jgi:hypothetical protein
LAGKPWENRIRKMATAVMAARNFGTIRISDYEIKLQKPDRRVCSCLVRLVSSWLAVVFSLHVLIHSFGAVKKVNNLINDEIACNNVVIN